jgi:Tfp pilus assembly protein PilF
MLSLIQIVDGARRRARSILVLVPVAALLAACAGDQAAAPAVVVAPPPPPPPVATAPATPTAPTAPTAVVGVPAAQRFQLAVNLLEQGNPDQAKAELNAYLAEVPTSPQARALLAQIETPLEMLYPPEHFTVQLAMGETLGSLATTYLGDVRSFYALARYNGIAVPRTVALGQTIKIPITPVSLGVAQARGIAVTPPPGMVPAAPPTTVAAAPPPAVAPRPGAPRDPWAIIRGEVAAGRYDAAIREAEASRLMPDRVQAAVLASAYAGSARTVRATNAPLAATLATRAGELYLETADQPEAALEPLHLAVMIAPENMRAQTLLTSAKTRASDIHYRAGLQLFQRQDLDGAIASWDKVLAIDPEHRNAQLQKAQALELKANLQRLRPN